MRTFEEIKTELVTYKNLKIELENKIDKASPTAFDYLNDLDIDLYTVERAIDLLEWVLVEEEDRLKIIWDRQKKFDDIVFKNAGVTREGTTLHRKIALVAEIGEMFNEHPDFKCWKKHKNTEVTDALKEEFVDVLHFLISLGIDIFRDEQEMFEWYCKKNDKNLERQKNGY